MELFFLLAQISSAIAFLTYGIACFFSESLRVEFKRYGMEPFQKLIGALEIAGALGLLVGIFYDPLRVLSASCLALLMFFAILVRIKIKDPFILWLPALILLLINLSVASTGN